MVVVMMVVAGVRAERLAIAGRRVTVRIAGAGLLLALELVLLVGVRIAGVQFRAGHWLDYGLLTNVVVNNARRVHLIELFAQRIAVRFKHVVVELHHD